MEAVRHEWVRRLAPAGDTALDDAASPAALVADAVERVGTGPVRWALEVSDAVVGRMVEDVPTLGGSPAAVELLRRGNEATTLQTLCTLEAPASPALTAGEANLEGIRAFVRRSVPLEEVLRGLRVGHAATTEAFLQACADVLGPEGALAEMTVISRDLFRHVDRLSDAMIRTYVSEHESWSTSAAAARAELVRTLLDGAAAVDPAAASRSLGYQLSRNHQAVVVWSDSPDRGPVLGAAAADVLRAMGATATLAVPVGSGRLWAWGAMPSGEAPTARQWDGVREVLERHGVQAAVGEVEHGVDGFRRSHRQAVRGVEVEQVRRRAGLPPRSATVYADVAAVALSTVDLDAAGAFVRSRLGRLAEPGEPTATLRRTLHHYLDAERSLQEVARRLHVARGTVTYRVRRAQEVLDRPLDERRHDLVVALALAEEFGDAVLLPDGPR